MEAKERYEYEEVSLLSPYAVGVPGKRTFFLGLGKKNNWMRIWLEKEHLQALAVGIEQLLLTLAQEEIVPQQVKDEETPSDDIPSGLPSAELDIIQMTLGYDEGRATIELLVERSGSREKDLSEVYCKVTLTQLKKLGSLATTVCAAGRPLCPICGGPIDPTGHVCPKEN